MSSPAREPVRVGLGLCVAAVTLALGVGVAVGFYTSFGRHAVSLSRTVALARQPVAVTPGGQADALRGAHIFAGPVRDGVRVVLRIRGVSGPGYWREAEVLGTVPTFEDAVARFGALELTEGGVQVGAGEHRRTWSWSALERRGGSPDE